MNDDKNVLIRDLADAPEEEKIFVRRIVAEGKVLFAPGVQEEIEAMGVTMDDIVAAFLRATGKDS